MVHGTGRVATQRHVRGSALWPQLAVALLCYGCVASQNNSGETTTGTEETSSEVPTEPGPSPGEPGAPCQTDADCADGGACLPPVFTSEGDRICGPPCNVTADCDSLAAFDYSLEVGLPSPSGNGNNFWNSPTLYRGLVCEAGHCQFLCPDKSAVAFGDDDNAIGCACLPHFTFDDDETHCVWDKNVQCAILEKDGTNPCNACNSEELFPGCSTGRFQCLLYTETFAGHCVEWAEASEVKACSEGNAGYDCNEECYSNCAEAQCNVDFCNVDVDGCLNVCCVPTDSSPDPDSCDPTGGTDDTGGADTDGGEEDTPAECTDMLDNDGNGFFDCDASLPDFNCCGVGDCGCTGACAGKGACAEDNEAACNDGQDNDGDGYIDCDANSPDFQCCGVGSCSCSGACAGKGACAEDNEAACNDGQDNDGDGYIDCDANAPDFQCCGVGSCPCTGACAGSGACA